MEYDVVIIGAGPSGVSAAHNLINNNISCIIIEKQKFPRNKLCGGGVTYKTFNLLKDLKMKNEFTGEDILISENAKLYLEYDFINKIKCTGLTYMVDRFDFDSYLVNEYKEKGGTILEESRVDEIDTKNNRITLGNGETVNFKYIIGADGAVGITKKLLKQSKPANGFCLQVEIDRKDFNYDGNDMSLYYGVIPNGYGWIFPKKSSLTIGFGGDYDKKINYHEEFEKFLNNIGVKCEREIYKGAFLPFGEYIKNPINEDKNVLLVGDAAGLVDPITGEGIYFAVKSGIEASNVIIKSLRKNNPDEIGEYEKSISDITRNISKGTKLKKLIYKFRKQIFTAMRNDKFGSFVFNECLYNSNYDLLQLIFKRK